MTRSQVSRINLKKKADALFSASIRERGYCELAPLFPAIRCNGRLQCCHVVSRRYLAVRWVPRNALCGCAAHHLYGTHHPLEWMEAVPGFEEMKIRVSTDPPMDPAGVIASLMIKS